MKNFVDCFPMNKRHFNVKEMAGQRFGKLVVQEFSYSHLKFRNAYWKCKCDCGNEKIIQGSHMRLGIVKSCGCMPWGRPKIKDRKQVLLNHEYHSKIKRFRTSKTSFHRNSTLSFEDWCKLVQSPCYYCGKEWSRILVDNRGWKSRALLSDSQVRCNGIDRIDSSITYIKENCVSCCTFCNFAKNSLSQEEFYRSIKRLHEHLQITGQFKELEQALKQ